MRAHTPKTLVLCEGEADMLVMEGLATHAGLAQNLKFQSYNGGSKMRDFLANLKVSPEFARGEYTKILVTRDADASYEAAVQSLKDAILDVFSVIVEAPGNWADLYSSGKITSYVVPGSHQTGMIETLCLNAARAKNPDQFTCLDSFIDCLEGQWGQRPHEKVRFILWSIIAQGVSAQDRLSLKYAIRNLDFNWENVAYSDLRQLFQSLD